MGIGGGVSAVPVVVVVVSLFSVLLVLVLPVVVSSKGVSSIAFCNLRNVSRNTAGEIMNKPR